MDKVASLSKNKLYELFNETAILKKITPAIAEKDFWSGIFWSTLRQEADNN